MSFSSHQVDSNLCKGDGICVKVCPKNVFEMVDNVAMAIEARKAECISCGQCIAVCPSDAIQNSNLPAELFEKLEKRSSDYRELYALMNARRSVRRFKDRPVDRELIEKIVQAASTAPMGEPPHTTEILIIDDPKELDQLREDMVKDYKELVWAGKNPIIRHLVRWQVGAELFNTIKGHVLPIAERANEAFDKDGMDQYLYHAPVLMLFHGNRWGISYEENAHLICTYSMLAAQALGLGTTIIGMIPPIVDRSKDLRNRYGIPKDNKVITSLILGHPKFKYRKSIKREFPSVRFIGS